METNNSEDDEGTSKDRKSNILKELSHEGKQTHENSDDKHLGASDDSAKSGKSEKIIFPKVSDNLHNYNNLSDIHSAITSIDFKLVRLFNEIADVHQKTNEATENITNDIADLNERIGELTKEIGNIPRDTLKEVHQDRKNNPDIYEELKEVMIKKAHPSLGDAMDANILKIIKESGKIDSHNLLAKVIEKHVCSKNTLYTHLKRLSEVGVVQKTRLAHEVFYSTDAEIPDIKEESTNVKEPSKEEEISHEEGVEAPKEEPEKEEAKPEAPKEVTQTMQAKSDKTTIAS